VTFWSEGSRPFSLKFWGEVRRERRRLKRDRKLGHGWIWIESENLGECYRCGDRSPSLTTGEFRIAPDRDGFDYLKERLLAEEEG